MKAIRLCSLIAFTILIGSCVFFAVSSEFYVDNQSNYSIKAVWQTTDGASSNALLAAGERCKIGEGKMIETNKVLPSDVLSNIAIYVMGNTDWTLKYEQSPIDNQAWLESSGSGNVDYIFDLVVSNASLGM